MKKSTGIILFIVLVVALSYNRWGYTGNCVLCKTCPYHEPCIINLSTGDIFPLTVYDPHPFKPGELAEEQQDGFLSLIHYPGISGYRCTNSRETVATVEVKQTSPLWRVFCFSCRRKLNSYSEMGFILADLNDPNKATFYSLGDNTIIAFRCYTISIMPNVADNQYTISVQGTLK